MWFLSFNKVFVFLFWFYAFFSPGYGERIPDVWQVPSENPYFIGREDYLKKLTHIFQTHSSKLAVLAAGPGFGKSQIAKRYAHQKYSSYQVVWWFRANQYMEPQFREFAEALAEFYNFGFAAKAQTMSLKRLKVLVNNVLRKKNLHCLIIFDHVAHHQDIESYIPQSHRNTVHIIVTTRNGNFVTNKISVHAFTKEEALDYVKLLLPEESPEAQNMLVDYVHNHPSTLKFSLSYITDYPGMTIDTYIRDHHQKHNQLFTHTLMEVKEDLTDDYRIVLPAAILLNLEKLKSDSQKAYTLLGLLTLLHRDQIQLDLIKRWLKKKHPKENLLTLIGYLRKHGFLDSEGNDKKAGAYVSMHELIQKITGSLIPDEEKKELINDACHLLEDPFSERTDIAVERTVRHTIPLLNAEKVLADAHRINYRTVSLTRLRAQVFDVVMCGLRDFEKAKELLEILEEEMRQGVQLPEKDYILHLISLSFFSSMYKPDYHQAIQYGEEALKRLEARDDMWEEKIQLIANLMQFYSFQGKLETCANFYQKGRELLEKSKSTAYNALFIYATSLYLLDSGKPAEAIELIQSHKDMIARLDDYLTIRFYTLNELALSYIKCGNFEKAQETLIQAEADAKEFYDNEDNTFFARLRVLQKACCFKELPLEESLRTIQRSLRVYEDSYHGPDKHVNQADAYFILGKIYEHHENYEKAKIHYLKCEKIFDKLLKNKSLDSLSDLYKCLALLGVKLQDESLTHTYLKKHMEIFGLDNHRTQEVILFLDEQGLSLPF